MVSFVLIYRNRARSSALRPMVGAQTTRRASGAARERRMTAAWSSADIGQPANYDPINVSFG
jgi:hypothetical protein